MKTWVEVLIGLTLCLILGPVGVLIVLLIGPAMGDVAEGRKVQQKKELVDEVVVMLEQDMAIEDEKARRRGEHDERAWNFGFTVPPGGEEEKG